MSFSKNTWNQLKNLTVERLIKALEDDGWERQIKSGATLPFRHPDGKIIVVHYHPKKTYGSGLLKKLLADIGWSEDRMKELKLLK